MDRIAVYTTVFKNYDNLKGFDKGYLKQADFFCFTDNLNINHPHEWTLVQVNDVDDSRFQARLYKALPHLSMEDYEYHMWVDASFYILDSPNYLIERYMKEHDVVAFQHPDRTCIYHEAKMCEIWKRETPYNVSKLIQYLQQENYPISNGLCETGVVIRKNNKKIREFNELWWQMLSGFSLRDQLSFNYCLWKLGIEYNTFEGLTNVQQGSPQGSYRTKHFDLQSHK